MIYVCQFGASSERNEMFGTKGKCVYRTWYCILYTDKISYI